MCPAELHIKHSILIETHHIMIYTIICMCQDSILELHIIAVAHVYDFLLLKFRFMHHKNV